jgi:hypothetical protein
MEVIIISQNGIIEDKKYDKDVINQLANDTSYSTEKVSFVHKDDCYIYRISQSPEKYEKNDYATNLVSNENNPIYGETIIIKISKYNEIQNINLDYLMTFLFNNELKITENNETHRSYNQNTYTEEYHNYCTAMYDHFGGYESY